MYYSMQRSVKDFFAKNVKRKHDSDPNNIVTKSNVSEPVPTPPKKTKRPKNFQDNWLKEYNWLEFRDTKMYCSMCINASSLRKSVRSNAFVSGTSNFQRSALIRHMDSDDHILAKKTNTERNYMTAAKKIVTKRYLPVLEAQLKTATVMAEENIPNRKFLTLIDLQVNFP
jgi:hypothetical protein